MYNILIGGAAGQGIDTTVNILEKLLKRAGYYVYSTKDFMSRVRGGHNFTAIRFGNKIITSHSNKFDCIVALNEETVILHKDKLKENGFIICNSNFKTDVPQMIKLNIEKAAEALGNKSVSGSIVIGAILKMFGENLNNIEDVLKTSIKEQFLEINLKAINIGYGSIDSKFSHISGQFNDWMILSGNKALVLGAIAAGLKFYSAYPMSPATSIMEFLASKSNDAEIVVEQAEDEIAAINMAIGASFAGVRSMTGTSGGGFCLMVEALGLSGVAEIPIVIVDVQRPGPATGLPTRTEQADLKFVISASQGEFPRMVIALRNHNDAFYQTIRALNLAEKYQIPVIILSDQYLADTSACVPIYDISDIHMELPANSDSISIDGVYHRYSYMENGISPRLIPGKSKNLVVTDSHEHDEKGKITESAEIRINMFDKRMKKLEKLEEELLEPEFFGNKDCDILIIGWGSTYGPIKEAVKVLNDKNNNKYGALIFGDIYPLPTKLLREHASIAKTIINVEQNGTGQLAGLIRETTGIECNLSILKYDGRQISGEEIVAKILSGGDK